MISDETDPFSTAMNCNKMSVTCNVKNADVIVEPCDDEILDLMLFKQE